jgi:hypothetical protein
MTTPSGGTGGALSEARRELARCIRAASEAADEQERAYAPARRLSELIRATERGRARLAELRREDDLLLAEWLAGPMTMPRPEPSAELRATEVHAAEMERDARAAQTALDRMGGAQQAANTRLADAARRRTLAAFDVAVEEAAALGCEWTQRLNGALAVQERLESLALSSIARTPGTTGTSSPLPR